LKKPALTLFQEFGAARAVEIIKRFECGGFGFLDGLQAGPFEQEAGGQGPPQILAAEHEGLRKVDGSVLTIDTKRNFGPYSG
jgi:hypothetical protein